MMDVIIDNLSGSPFSINVDFWETVLTIKEKIEKSQGIPVSKQTLYFQGKVLQDHVGKFNCTIFFDSRLLLSISSEDNPNQNNDQTEESQQQIDEFVKKQDRSLMSNNDQMLKAAVTGKKLTKVMARRINNEYSSRPAYSLVELLAPQTTEQSPPSDSAREVLPVEKKIKPNPMKLTVYVKPYEDDPRIIRVEVNADDNVEELRKELVKMQERGELYLPHQGFYLVDSGILLTESKSFKWNLVLDGHKIEITQRKYS